MLKILDLKIENIGQQAILSKFASWLDGQKQYQVATVNPEFLLTAQKDEEFFHVLRRSFNIVDGFGLKIAGWLKGVNLQRLSGADLVKDILTLAQAKNKKLAIVNWQAGLSSAKEIEVVIRKNWPRLNFLVIDQDKKNIKPSEILKNWPVDILLCNFGAPEQEKFIFYNLPKLPTVKFAMGVGGSFDFLTNKIKRAPKLFRAIGMEWLWRLIKQPTKRIKRIFNAVVVFTLTVIKQEIINQFFYRKNVVALLINENNETLLLNAGHKNYWSLPQGGVEFLESKESALRRELKEETGLTDFIILARYDNLYKYRWPKNYAYYGYKGQKQSLFILRVKSRPMINLNPYEHQGYKWIKLDRLLTEADPIHQQQYKIFLSKIKNL